MNDERWNLGVFRSAFISHGSACVCGVGSMFWSESPLVVGGARMMAFELRVPRGASAVAVELSFRGSLPWLLVAGLLLGLGVLAVVLYLNERGSIGPVRR